MRLKHSGAGSGNRTRISSLEGLGNNHYTMPAITNKSDTEKIGRWWRGKDSNLRRQSRQIYSLIPLATREPLHNQPVSGLTTVLSFDSGDYDIQTLLIMQEKILIFFHFFYKLAYFSYSFHHFYSDFFKYLTKIHVFVIYFLPAC